MRTSTCFGDYGRKNITREVLACTISSVQSPPAENRGQSHLGPCYWEEKREFHGILLHEKILKMDMEAMAYRFTTGNSGGRCKIRGKIPLLQPKHFQGLSHCSNSQNLNSKHLQRFNTSNFNYKFFFFDRKET
jgi:hypothetical protein